MKRLTCLAISMMAFMLVAGPADSSAAAKNKILPNAVVKSVTSVSLTVTSTDGKDMTFAVDAKTKVRGKGIGTKTAAKGKGGKASIADLLGVGDRVNVVYADIATPHAASVELIQGASK